MNRTILIFLLLFATRLTAQQAQTSTATTATNTTTTATATTSVAQQEPLERQRPRTAEEVREMLNERLRRVPSDLPTVIALDPSLLANEKFIADYPELQAFVAAHPEIRRNPTYYFGEYRPRNIQRSATNDIAEMIAVVSGFSIAGFTLIWLVRTWVDQIRWSRMARTQAEVHNKILDRFGTGPELLEYVKSSAGTKFLESAPIPVHAQAERTSLSAPTNRMMWSIQLGIIIAAGGLGMLLVSFRLEPDAGRALFAMGAIGFCIGVGFMLSAAASVIVSKRLGLWRGESDDPGGVR
jgi:hypothetical protein